MTTVFWTFAIAGLIIWLVVRGRKRRAAQRQRDSARPTPPHRTERLQIDLSVPGQMPTPVVVKAAAWTTEPIPSSHKSAALPSVALVGADQADDWKSGLSADDLRLIEQFGVSRSPDGFLCRHYRFQTLNQALGYARLLSGEPKAPTANPAFSELLAQVRGRGLHSDKRPNTPTGGVLLPDPLSRTSQAATPLQPQHRPEPPLVSTNQQTKARFAKPNRAKTEWFGGFHPVEIGGVSIASPMIYVGPTTSWDTPRDRVDPSLRVGMTAEDQLGLSLNYWPSYHALSSGGRRTYLDWLASGRRTRVGIGYVFIFFYGLERRLFVDGATGEVDAIVDEIERLLVEYADNNSFIGYARRFLTSARMLRPTTVEAPQLSPDLRAGEWEMPLAVRRYLGGRLTDGRPFDADDCMLWILAMPDTWLAASGRRCFPELLQLWRARFAVEYPDGVKVRAPQRKLSAHYRSASREFEAELSLGDLPDIAALTQPVTRLRDTLLGWQIEFENLSKLLLKKPDARGSLEAALCLPADLIEGDLSEQVSQARSALKALMAESVMASVSARDVLRVLHIEDGDAKLAVSLQRHIATLMDRLGFSFEPDRRHTEASLSRDGVIVLFHGRAAAPVEISQSFIAARTMVEIALLAAAADGEVVPAELEQIRSDLDTIPGLTSDERLRLSAHALWLSNDPPRLQSALKRLNSLPAGSAQAATQAAVATVLADGRVLPAEVRFLEKLHTALGLAQDQAYAALHRGAHRSDEPVMVASGELVLGVPIPEEKSVLSFDASRLARIREETSQVSALLSSIFIDDAPEQVSVSEPVKSGSSTRYPGLDDRHAALLFQIVTEGPLDRESFDARVRSHKLLPSGAIETINDWAFETFDEPILEDEDDIYAAAHLALRLKDLEIAT